jgi:hypothetical protein
MHAMGQMLGFLALVVLITCIVWLHWRALRDGAFPDVLLMFTGVSLLWYISNRWRRAKMPVLGILAGSLILTIAIVLTNRATASLNDDAEPASYPSSSAQD